ncbi:protein-disulfide reductase DsbD domain-containing protein [Emcibacter sp.]|uniref:protein-disulfide reductase DsbD domain-containing protein n=1 Tax=Emcibacter sp. TaxID=1979954 RepID=UPI002AA94124|nr:protein-disulfide reductase DsbD domain-containing protein [Emcibacter sp.]
MRSIVKIVWSGNIAGSIQGILLAVAVIFSAGAAENSSHWISNQYTSSRLFVGDYDAQKKIIHIGWQVKLKDGWKTYWRTPGEAGMPPSWNWDNSGDLREIAVKWPVPERMTFFGYVSNVYHDELVVPIEVHLGSGDGQVALALTMDFMICKEVCIPLTADYRLELDNLAGLEVSLYQQALLEKFRNRVPREEDPGFLYVQDNGKGLLTVSLKTPESGGITYRDLFVEGPEDFYFSEPRLRNGADSVLFEIPYTQERSHGSLVGEEVILTLVPGAGQAREVRARIVTE